MLNCSRWFLYVCMYNVSCLSVCHNHADVVKFQQLGKPTVSTLNGAFLIFLPVAMDSVQYKHHKACSQWHSRKIVYRTTIAPTLLSSSLFIPMAGSRFYDWDDATSNFINHHRPPPKINLKTVILLIIKPHSTVLSLHSGSTARFRWIK